MWTFVVLIKLAKIIGKLDYIPMIPIYILLVVVINTLIINCSNSIHIIESWMSILLVVVYYFTKLHYLWIVLVWFFPILISEWILILSDISKPTWILVLERFLPTFKVSAYWGVEFLNLEEVEKILWTLEMGRGKICACCFFEKPFNIGALGLRKANQSILQGN